MSKKQRTLYDAWNKLPIPSTSHGVQSPSNVFQPPRHDSRSTLAAPDFDYEAGKTWIYPTNYPVRDYQFHIVQEALFKNTIVILPTGLGKTFIAAVVMYNIYRWYPKGKVVFMAPTKPLVAQQVDACTNITGIPRDDIVQMTGSNNPEARTLMWQRKRVFFLTPQVLINDLVRNICPATSIKCLVVDEAHKALGNHAYCQVIKELSTYTSQFRVLALTATPGGETQAVRQVLTNLLISHVELRSEDSEDVKPYTHGRNIEKIVVPLGDRLNNLKSKFLDVINVYLKKLTQRKAMNPKNPSSLSKFQMLKLREAFSQHPPPNMDRFLYGLAMADFSLCISLYHAYELLLLHGATSFYNFLNGILDGDKSIPHARSELKKNSELTEIMQFVKETYIQDPVTTALPNGIARNHTRKVLPSHPKLEKLMEVVVNHFKTAERENVGETRVMIFTQYRDSVHEIVGMLNSHQPLIKVMSFVGQSSKTATSSGISQKQQMRVIQQFRSGGYNTLVSTCVGEEGLDIGEVDLIVCYDCPKSPTRMVQRMGRTGRLREGRIVILVAEGKEEQMFNSCEYKKKSVNKAINKGFSYGQLYQSSPSLLPPGVKPVCVKTAIEVKPKPAATKALAGSSKSPYLTEEELIEFEKHVETERIDASLLPKQEYLLFKKPSDLEASVREEAAKPQLSLSRWTLWQTTAQRTCIVPHSSKSMMLIKTMECIHFPDLLDSKNSSLNLSDLCGLSKKSSNQTRFLDTLHTSFKQSKIDTLLKNTSVSEDFQQDEVPESPVEILFDVTEADPVHDNLPLMQRLFGVNCPEKNKSKNSLGSFQVPPDKVSLLRAEDFTCISKDILNPHHESIQLLHVLNNKMKAKVRRKCRELFDHVANPLSKTILASKAISSSQSYTAHDSFVFNKCPNNMPTSNAATKESENLEIIKDDVEDLAFDIDFDFPDFMDVDSSCKVGAETNADGQPTKENCASPEYFHLPGVSAQEVENNDDGEVMVLSPTQYCSDNNLSEIPNATKTSPECVKLLAVESIQNIPKGLNFLDVNQSLPSGTGLHRKQSDISMNHIQNSPKTDYLKFVSDKGKEINDPRSTLCTTSITNESKDEFCDLPTNKIKHSSIEARDNLSNFQNNLEDSFSTEPAINFDISFSFFDKSSLCDVQNSPLCTTDSNSKRVAPLGEITQEKQHEDAKSGDLNEDASFILDQLFSTQAYFPLSSKCSVSTPLELKKCKTLAESSESIPFKSNSECNDPLPSKSLDESRADSFKVPVMREPESKISCNPTCNKSIILDQSNTQCTMTQLLSLLNSPKNSDLKSSKLPNISMKLVQKSSDAADNSSEDEVCPTPPKEVAKSKYIYSYKNPTRKSLEYEDAKESKKDSKLLISARNNASSLENSAEKSSNAPKETSVFLSNTSSVSNRTQEPFHGSNSVHNAVKKISVGCAKNVESAKCNDQSINQFATKKPEKLDALGSELNNSKVNIDGLVSESDDKISFDISFELPFSQFSSESPGKNQLNNAICISSSAEDNFDEMIAKTDGAKCSAQDISITTSVTKHPKPEDDAGTVFGEQNCKSDDEFEESESLIPLNGDSKESAFLLPHDDFQESESILLEKDFQKSELLIPDDDFEESESLIPQVKESSIHFEQNFQTFPDKVQKTTLKNNFRSSNLNVLTDLNNEHCLDNDTGSSLEPEEDDFGSIFMKKLPAEGKAHISQINPKNSIKPEPVHQGNQVARSCIVKHSDENNKFIKKIDIEPEKICSKVENKGNNPVLEEKIEFDLLDETEDFCMVLFDSRNPVKGQNDSVVPKPSFKNSTLSIKNKNPSILSKLDDTIHENSSDEFLECSLSTRIRGGKVISEPKTVIKAKHQLNYNSNDCKSFKRSFSNDDGSLSKVYLPQNSMAENDPTHKSKNAAVSRKDSPSKPSASNAINEGIAFDLEFDQNIFSRSIEEIDELGAINRNKKDHVPFNAENNSGEGMFGSSAQNNGKHSFKAAMRKTLSPETKKVKPNLLPISQSAQSIAKSKDTNKLESSFARKKEPVLEAENEEFDNDDDFQFIQRINSNKSKSKQRKKREKNIFLLTQAEVSESDGSDRASLSEDEDGFLESFIDDDSPDKMNHSDVHAFYLKSVKDRVGLPQQFKMKPLKDASCSFLPYAHDGCNSYMFDSFCVGNEEVQYLSSDEEPEHIVEGRNKRKAPKLKKGGKKLRRVELNESTTSCELDASPNVPKHKELETAKHILDESAFEVKKNKRRVIISSDEEEESNFKALEIQQNAQPEVTRNSNGCEDKFEISIDFDNDFIPLPNSNMKNVSASKDNSVTGKKEHVQTKHLSSLQGPYNPPNKCSKVDQNKTQNRCTFESKNQSIDTSTSYNQNSIRGANIGQSSNKQANSYVKETNKACNPLSKDSVANSNFLPPRFVLENWNKPSTSASAICATASKSTDPIAPNDDISIAFDIDWEELSPATNASKLLTDTSGCLSSKPSSSNQNAQSVILVDSRELAGGKPIISALRSQYNVNPVVMQLKSADYILSNRMAVERVLDSEFSNHMMPPKLVEKVKDMNEIYEKAVLIIEQDTRKSVLSFKKNVTKFLQFVVQLRTHLPVTVLYSKSSSQTCELIYSLINKEKSRNFSINVPVAFNLKNHNLYEFYCSIPKINSICALNLLYYFPSIESLSTSSAQDIQKKGCISSHKANRIYKYFHHELTYYGKF